MHPIGVWGRSARHELKSAIDTRVTVAELRRRVPRASFVVGDASTAGGDLVPPLAGRTPLDALVLVGEVTDPDWARGLTDASGTTPDPVREPPFALSDWPEQVPSAWSAVTAAGTLGPDVAALADRSVAAGTSITVSDELSRRNLLELVQHDIDVVPPLAILLPRVVEAVVLRERMSYLQRMGWYPASPTILVQGSARTVPLVARLVPLLRAALGSRPDACLTVVELAPDGEAFTRALASAAPELQHVVPSEATIEDLAASVAGSSACLAADPHLAASAAAFGRPMLLLDTGDPGVDELARLLHVPRIGNTSIEALPNPIGSAADGRIVDALTTRVDEHFDRVAQHLAVGWARRPGAGDDPLLVRLERLERAYDAVVGQLHDERVLYRARLQLMEDDVKRHRDDAEAARAAVIAATDAYREAAQAAAASPGRRG